MQMLLTILDLPDNVLLSVFKRFDIRELAELSKVCKKWYQYTHDPSLWTKLNLKTYRNNLNLENLKQLIYVYGSDALRELHICGNFNEDYVSIMSNNSNDLNFNIETDDDSCLYTVDREFISLLKYKCHNLERITFEYLNLSQLDYGKLIDFYKLKELSFIWCFIGNNWFANANTNDDSYVNVKSLKMNCLNLIRTSHLNKYDIQTICDKMPYLKVLCINEAKSSVDDESIVYLASKLVYLEKLELINTLISDVGVVALSKFEHLQRNLKHLNLSLSTSLTNLSIITIGNCFRQLNYLYLTSCFGFNELFYLENLLKLKYLNLNNTSINKSIIETFYLKLPTCEVEYGHEKILKRKLAWTINGSMNCVCSF